MLGMHRNENSWPKPNKMKHWAEGQIQNMFFLRFFPSRFRNDFHYDFGKMFVACITLPHDL